MRRILLSLSIVTAATVAVARDDVRPHEVHLNAIDQAFKDRVSRCQTMLALNLSLKHDPDETTKQFQRCFGSAVTAREIAIRTAREIAINLAEKAPVSQVR